MASKISKIKAKRKCLQFPRTRPLPTIAKKQWRSVASRPVGDTQKFLECDIRALLGQLSLLKCSEAERAPDGFSSCTIITSGSSALLSGEFLRDDLEVQDLSKRRNAARQFYSWTRDEFKTLVSEEVADDYFELTRALLPMPAEYSLNKEEEEAKNMQYLRRRSDMYDLVEKHQDVLPFSVSEFECIVDMILLRDVENSKYHYFEECGMHKHDAECEKSVCTGHFPITLDFLLSVVSGRCLSGLLSNNILPWNVVHDNLSLCSEFTLIEVATNCQPCPGYGQMLLHELIERELIDSHIRLVSIILQKELRIDDAMWIPSLLKQLCSAAANKKSCFRSFSRKTADQIIANLINCFKNLISPGWGTNKLLMVLGEIDDGKWIPSLCSGKHWQQKDINRLCANSATKLCNNE